MIYEEQIEYCKKQGGQLIKIESKAENVWIQENIPITDSFALGAKRLPKNLKTTDWIDDEPVKWYNWGRYDPKRLDTHCDEIYVNSAGANVTYYRRLKWFTPEKTKSGTCDYLSPTLCEIKPRAIIKHHEHVRTTLSDIVNGMNVIKLELNKCLNGVKTGLKNRQSELVNVNCQSDGRLEIYRSNILYLYRMKEQIGLKYEKEKREWIRNTIQLNERIKQLEITNSRLKEKGRVHNDTRTS